MSTPSGAPAWAGTLFHTSDTPSPGVVARMLEERGADALLLPDHTHVPVGEVRNHPGEVRDLPPEYADLFDPIVAATVAAAATTCLSVGTAVCLLNQRDPIVTAKQLATLDQVSGGRLIVGVGAGWHEGEMRNHGVDPTRRFRMLRERIEAVTTIWAAAEASYDGETVSFAPLRSGPRPFRAPRPPLLLGGNGPRTPARALEWADGWLPHTELGGDGPLLERIAALRTKADAAFDITLAMSPTDPDRLAAFARAGVGRFLFLLPSGDRPTVERRVDRIAAAMGNLIETRSY